MKLTRFASEPLYPIDTSIPLFLSFSWFISLLRNLNWVTLLISFDLITQSNEGEVCSCVSFIFLEIWVVFSYFIWYERALYVNYNQRSDLMKLQIVSIIYIGLFLLHSRRNWRKVRPIMCFLKANFWIFMLKGGKVIQIFLLFSKLTLLCFYLIWKFITLQIKLFHSEKLCCKFIQGPCPIFLSSRILCPHLALCFVPSPMSSLRLWMQSIILSL